MIPLIEAKEELGLTKNAELCQVVLPLLLKTVIAVFERGLDRPLKNDVDAALLLCLVDVFVRLELDDLRSDA